VINKMVLQNQSLAAENKVIQDMASSSQKTSLQRTPSSLSSEL